MEIPVPVNNMGDSGDDDNSDDDGYSDNLARVSNAPPTHQDMEFYRQGLEATRKDVESFAAFRLKVQEREHVQMLRRVLLVAKLFVSSLEEDSSEC